MACAFALCACGGSSSSSASSNEESKSLPSSSIILKGKNANLYQIADETYTVLLVQTESDWQVRVKLNLASKTKFDQLKDYQNYERELNGDISAILLNSSEVEIESLDINDDDWDLLLQEDADEQISTSLKTYDYKHLSYDEAKAIFDKVAGLEISGIELEEIDKDNSSNASQKSTLKDAVDDAMNDDDMQDLKEAAETAGKILEAEKDLINALL